MPAALIASAAAVTLGIVAVLLVLLGGDDDEPAAASVAARPADVRLADRDVYAPISGEGYSALLPGGWKAAKPSGPLDLVNAVEVRSAQDEAARVTVGQPSRSARSVRRLASDLRAQVRGGAGYDETFFGPIEFPGNRPAYRLSYVRDGTERVVYAFRTCDRQYVVTGLAPSDQASEARARFGLTASTLQVLC